MAIQPTPPPSISSNRPVSFNDDSKENRAPQTFRGSRPNYRKPESPVRLANSDYPNREYLLEKEVEKVIDAAGTQERHGVVI
jgi:hypothetical protein